MARDDRGRRRRRVGHPGPDPSAQSAILGAFWGIHGSHCSVTPMIDIVHSPHMKRRIHHGERHDVLSIEFTISKDPDDDSIDITEDRGRVVYKIGPKLFETPQLLASLLTESARAVIAGGRWFQLWKGDVIAIDPAQREGRVPKQRPTDEVA